jgi:ComF family protein
MRPLGAVLGEWLARAYPRGERFDALVPMPLHWWKYLRRGFNQSALLAREVSRRTGVPLLASVCRTRSTKAQAGLTRAQRRDNVRASFRVRRPAEVQGRSLLLIDDVQTTGSTVNACARALKRAGAARVCVLTLSRAGRQQNPRLGDIAPALRRGKGVSG